MKKRSTWMLLIGVIFGVALLLLPDNIQAAPVVSHPATSAARGKTASSAAASKAPSSAGLRSAVGRNVIQSIPKAFYKGNIGNKNKGAKGFNKANNRNHATVFAPFRGFPVAAGIS
ncbi:hypothetical protein BBP95_14645 [Listeria monocytogenes]|nr:hypothetical protein [Listeria monocytogenes]